MKGRSGVALTQFSSSGNTVRSFITVALDTVICCLWQTQLPALGGDAASLQLSWHEHACIDNAGALTRHVNTASNKQHVFIYFFILSLVHFPVYVLQDGDLAPLADIVSVARAYRAQVC
jgi:hypothetical protein